MGDHAHSSSLSPSLLISSNSNESNGGGGAEVYNLIAGSEIDKGGGVRERQVSLEGDRERREVVEQPSEGVYITLGPHAVEGFQELRRVQFSSKKFSMEAAVTWWKENKRKLREEYKIKSNRTRN